MGVIARDFSVVARVVVIIYLNSPNATPPGFAGKVAVDGSRPMADVMLPARKRILWEEMQADFRQYAPAGSPANRLMCCACGRFLTFDEFSLEHIIPRRALRLDPVAVRQYPPAHENQRAKNLLLCTKPLKINGKILSSNGCNGWKGKHYDAPISDLLHRSADSVASRGGNHLIAGLVLGYLAMVNEFGYRVVLTSSGVLMREQFFNPRKFRPAIPVMSQIILAGSIPPETAPDDPIWVNPFSFTYSDGACFVSARNFSVRVPCVSDPYAFISRRVKILPPKYSLRPDFSTCFY